MCQCDQMVGCFVDFMKIVAKTFAKPKKAKISLLKLNLKV